MTALATDVDLTRLRNERRERLAGAFAHEDAAALLLLGHSNVAYATGANVMQIDASRSGSDRAVALLVAGEEYPHVFTPWRDGVPADYPGDRVHPPVYPDGSEGAARLAEFVRRVVTDQATRLLVDDLPATLGAVLATMIPGCTVDDAGSLVGKVRSRKTPDEVECIRRAQQINEAAMDPVRRLLSEGRRPAELSAEFLRTAFTLGCEACVVDPLWQPMPLRADAGPRTLAGGPAFPLRNSDRAFAPGDVVWIDSGVAFAGYHSDFGRTWTVDTPPSDRQRDQFQRWRDVVAAVLATLRPGATGMDLTAAARRAVGGATPWLPHLYLGHGIGLNSAETPLLGTDLGERYDASIVLEQGMVFVLEPVIWDDGYAGYRSEEIVVVTDDGYEQLSDYTYAPYDE